MEQRLANDTVAYRNSSKYLQHQHYLFRPPFGHERQSLRPSELLLSSNKAARPKSPIITRFPKQTYNPNISVTKLDFQWIPVELRPKSPRSAEWKRQQQQRATQLAKPLSRHKNRSPSPRRDNALLRPSRSPSPTLQRVSSPMTRSPRTQSSPRIITVSSSILKLRP